MLAAHATVPEAGGDCTWPLISGYGHGNTAVTRRGRPSRPGWPHRCQRLPNLRSRTFRCTCRALSPYQPFGCAFGARSAHSGAARLAGRTCASIVVRLNAAALKAIVSPVIHRIRSTRLVSRRPIHDRNPTDCVPRAREPGPPESRWPLERRRKGTAAGVIYRLRAGPGPCGGRRCRLRQAALVEGRWAGGWARPSAARASGVPRHRGYRASQPKTTCSPEPDCLGSGRRIMRNEISSPIKPARIGIRSAT